MGSSFLWFFLPPVLIMNNTLRFTSFKEAVNHLMDHCNLSNQEATHFIWDNQFTIGTDRAIWLSIPVDFGC